MCDCVDHEFQQYKQTVGLIPPEGLFTKTAIYVDICLATEVARLWNKGIVTSGSCCGHNSSPAFISVLPEYTDKMLAFGYEQYPERKDHFTAKSVKPEIHTEWEYHHAMKFIDKVFNATPGTDDELWLNVCVGLVEQYEAIDHAWVERVGGV